MKGYSRYYEKRPLMQTELERSPFQDYETDSGEESSDDSDDERWMYKGLRRLNIDYHQVRRALVITFGVLCLLLAWMILALGYQILHANEIAMAKFEEDGMEACGTEVKARSINVGILSGRTTIDGVTVANPPDYSGDFLSVRHVLLASSMLSCISRTVELKEMTMEGYNVSLQQKMGYSPNFVPVLDSLNKPSNPPRFWEPLYWLGGSMSSRRYIVDSLKMKDLDFKLSMSVGLGGIELYKAAQQNFQIPLIEIPDIGKKEGGVKEGELMSIVTHAVLSAAMEAAGNDFSSAMTTAIKNGARKSKELDFGSVHLDLGAGLKQISKLVDRLTDATPRAESAAHVQMSEEAAKLERSVAEARGWNNQREGGRWTVNHQKVTNAMDAFETAAEQMRTRLPHGENRL